MDFNKSIFRVFLRLSSVFLTLFSCIILSGCRYYRDVSSDQSISYLVGRKLELQEDIFIRKVDGYDNLDYELIELERCPLLPKSVEDYEKYGKEWYKYDERFQQLYREDKDLKPFKVVGVLKKGAILTITKIEKHGGYNYGPFIFIFFDTNYPLFKDKRVCLDITMYSAREENKAYNIRFKPQYLRLMN